MEPLVKKPLVSRYVQKKFDVATCQDASLLLGYRENRKLTVMI